MADRLRDADAVDLAGVVGVFLGCWRVSYRGLLPDPVVEAMTDERATELWRSALARGGALVLEREGAVVGVTRYSAGEIGSLYVSPDARGGGVGTRLLDAAVERMAAAGEGEASLWVFAANTPSLRFYESRGWKPDGTSRVEAEFGLPELRLCRRTGRAGT